MLKKSLDNLKSSLLLYAVTDRSWTQNQTLYEQVKLALEGGATLVQIREKNLPHDEFEKEAVELQNLCRKFNVPFVVNDDVHLAEKIGADGAHIGQSDGTIENARKILGAEKILGVSVQNVAQALEAERSGADYLGVGAVFPTSSKDDAGEVSLEELKDICRAVSIPVVAIGGITAENAGQLSDTGICGISVISAIFAQKDIKKAAQNLKSAAEKIAAK